MHGQTPNVENTIGVNVPPSASLILSSYDRFFSDSDACNWDSLQSIHLHRINFSVLIFGKLCLINGVNQVRLVWI